MKNNRSISASKIIRTFQRERELWFICIPLIIWGLIFCYYPMYGLVIAFQDYIPGDSFFANNWVGLKHFIKFFQSPDIGMIMRNTFAISGLNILFGFPAPIILAILFNELRSRKFQRVVQTISYLPYFISWVVAASIIVTILGSEGMLNQILVSLGITKSAIPFLNQGKYFWGIITVANIWKGVGWSTIIYLSAITGINHELYEAGAVDGLNRWGQVWHITIPGIMPTIILLWILGIGGILNAGFEQQLLLGNAQTREFYEVIDTYSYKYGIQLGRYSYATAISLMKSIIAVVLVFGTNKLSKKTLELSIF